MSRSCRGSRTRRTEQTVDYEYVYREKLSGREFRAPSPTSACSAIPRPHTGGLANITEMQSLLIRRCSPTSQASAGHHRFASMRSSEVYGIGRYYPQRASRPGRGTTSPTMASTPTMIASELGIHLRLKSCQVQCQGLRGQAPVTTRTTPPDKFRQTGPYRSTSVPEFVGPRVHPAHKGLQLVVAAGLRLSGISAALAVAVAATLFLHRLDQRIRAGGSAVAIFQLLFGYWATISPSATKRPILRREAPVVPVVRTDACCTPSPRAADLPCSIAATHVLRQRPGARYPLNDLKNKKKYLAFGPAASGELWRNCVRRLVKLECAGS